MIEKIKNLMADHGLLGLTLGGAGDAGIAVRDGAYVINVGDLPNLSFFIALAQLVGVPLESIKTEDEHNGPGCETCGYGGGTEYVITVPAKAS